MSANDPNRMLAANRAIGLMRPFDKSMRILLANRMLTRALYPRPMLDDQTIDAPTAKDSAPREVPLEHGRTFHTSSDAASEGAVMDMKATPPRSMTAVLPIMGVVSVAFLVIGFALPVLPLHVHQGLGLSTFVVGLVTGSQFAASLISRVWSGHYADSKGAKRAVVVGLLTAVAGGLLYLLSLGFVGTPWLSATILLGGRALLGGAESFVITGAVSWGLALAGPANTGRVIAWVGMAMFAALAFGAPVGTTLYALGGFAAVAVATILLPLITVLLVAPLTPVAVQRGSPKRAPEGARRRLASGIWLGIEHCRLRRDDRLQFAAVCRTRLEPALAHLQRVRDRLGGGPSLPRSYARQAGRRQGRAGLRVCRSGRPGSDLVRVRILFWRRRAPRSPASATHSSIPALALKPCAAHRRKVAASRWAPTRSFLTWRLGSVAPRSGCSPGGTGLGSVFLASAIVVLGAAGVAAWLLHSSRRSAHKQQKG